MSNRGEVFYYERILVLKQSGRLLLFCETVREDGNFTSVAPAPTRGKHRWGVGGQLVHLLV